MTRFVSVAIQLIIAGFFTYLISCSPEACFEETNAYLKASFYLDATGNYKAPDSLTLYGIGMDTNKLYDKAGSVQPALLPLNSATDNCTFVIRINGITDTIILKYSSYPHLISKECGYTFYHILNSYIVTNNIIDTIIVRNNNITTINEENVRIFY